MLARARELLKNLEAGEFDQAGRPRLARHATGQARVDAPAGRTDESQLGLFAGSKPAPAKTHPVLEALEAFSVDTTSPLEALTAIAKWKQLLKK